MDNGLEGLAEDQVPSEVYAKALVESVLTVRGNLFIDMDLRLFI